MLKKGKGFSLLLCVILLTIALVRYLSTVVCVSNTINGRELPIYAVKVKDHKIALSFDAAWGNDFTYELLEILKRNHVRGTFFMTGGWVKAYPKAVQEILKAGHDLGNHSETHKNMSQLAKTEKQKEIMAVHQEVKALTGYEMFLFRPPYGDYDNDTIQTATQCGYYTIQWSVDSLDWKDYGVDAIVNTVLHHKAMKPGAIILCHNGAKYTTKALERMIVSLKKQGYSFVPISELILRENYHMELDGTQAPDQSDPAS